MTKKRRAAERAALLCMEDGGSYFCTLRIIWVPLSRWTLEPLDVNVPEFELEEDDARLRPRSPITPWLFEFRDDEAPAPAPVALFTVAPPTLPAVLTKPPVVERTPPTTPPPVRVIPEAAPLTLPVAPASPEDISESSVWAAVAPLPIACTANDNGTCLPSFKTA